MYVHVFVCVCVCVCVCVHEGGFDLQLIGSSTKDVQVCKALNDQKKSNNAALVRLIHQHLVRHYLKEDFLEFAL